MNILTEHPTTVAAPASILHTVEHIALGKLVPSAANVRRMNQLVGVSELADSIEAHGLIHNLTVRRTKKGKYEVVAGARRLAALTLLAKEQRLTPDTDIPCNLLTDADDAEISLAENVQREAMHVVDEILAYRDLAERGMDMENIAARFGQSVITVRQRLKLAHLSPEILDVLRDDKMSLEQARALAISDSHDEQNRAWFDTVGWNRDPHSLRSILTREHVRSTERLARFVGVDAYESAGGTVLRDLFASSETTFLTDRVLLNQLAASALEQAAAPLKAEGWKWIEVTLDANALHHGGFARVYPQARAFTEDEQARLSALAERYDELEVIIGSLSERDDLHAAEQNLAEVEAEMEALQEAVKAYDPQEVALAGCIVTIDQSGTMQAHRGYVAADDIAVLERLRRGDTGADDIVEDEDADHKAPALSENTPDGVIYSAALVEELTAIRTAAMRIELANRPTVALAALLYPMVGRMYHVAYASFDAAVEVSGQHRNLTPYIKEPDEARALTAWNAMHEAWGETLPGQPADLWTWLLDQSTDKLLELLAFATAANLNAVKAKHDHNRARLANAEQIAQAVNLDMRNHWTADATFLSRLSKAGIAEVLTHAGCATQAIRAVEKAPKPEAVLVFTRN